jgi:hypothetical protein
MLSRDLTRRLLRAQVMVLGAGLLCMVLAQALAQAQAPSVSKPLPHPNEVTVAGILVARFRVGAGGFTPEQRADKVVERIVAVFSREDLAKKPVEIRGKEKEPSLYVGDQLLVTITLADAAATKSTPMELARKWQSAFSQALAAGQPVPIKHPAK